MAGKSAVLNVSVLVDAAKAAAGLNDTASRFESFGKKVVGAVVGAVAIKGVTDLAKTVVTAASSMEQAMGGTDKVFGSSASEIHKWAADTSDSIRLPAVAVEQYATLIKTQLAATGQPMAALVTSTKNLIQVGADLAAVTGKDLAGSIAAVKSALAGEYDPIQNLGVAMSGASVQARALSIAHGDTAEAATDAVIMQARVAEIMEKSAFATGAAAEEANSFQGRMDALNEKTQNLAAVVGGPLLDSLGNIVGGITDAASGAETLGVGLGVMLGSVLSLPGPIQAIVLGLAGFITVSAVWGSKVTGVFTSFIGTLRTATGSLAGFRAAMAGIGASLAGGAIIVGIALAIGSLASAIGHASEVAKDGEDALQGYRDAIVEAGGASTDATAKAFSDSVTQSKAFAALIAEGVAAEEAVKLLTGTTEEFARSGMTGSQAARTLSTESHELTQSFIDANGHAKTLAQSQIDGAKAMNTAEGAAATFGPTIEESEKAAADAADKAAESLKKMTQAAQDAANSTSVSRFFAQLSFDATSAERAVKFFGATMDAVTGRFTGYEGAVQGMQDALRSTGEAFKDAAEAGELNLDAVARWDVRALSATASGSKLVTELSGLSSAYSKNVGEAFAAAEKTGDMAYAISFAQQEASAGYTDFMAMAGAAGLTAEQAAAAAAKLGIFNGTEIKPKVFELIMQDEAARAALATIQAQGIDPKIVTLVPDDLATPAIETALSYVDATGATVTIPIHATAAPAEEVVDEFTGQKLSTSDQFIGVNANITKADATVRQFMVAQRTAADIMVGANTGPANDAIRLVMVAQRTASDIKVDANVSAAQSAISAVERGSYRATVYVYANTDNFTAAFNSLPSSKGVSASTNAAPVLPNGFAAPQLSTASAKARSTTATATAGLTINVSGALWPDDAARAVQNVLRRRDRRVGAVRI